MKRDPLNSTADGQRRMFWQAHDEVAADMHARMAQMSYDAGCEDQQKGIPARFPKNPDYMRGYSEASPDPLR